MLAEDETLRRSRQADAMIRRALIHLLSQESQNPFKGHDLDVTCRSNAVVNPVINFVCELLPEETRQSSRTELIYEDLDELPSNDVARIYEWLVEKVDCFSSQAECFSGTNLNDAELKVQARLQSGCIILFILLPYILG